jgi:hypothetical protein
MGASRVAADMKDRHSSQWLGQIVIHYFGHMINAKCRTEKAGYLSEEK